MRGAGDHSAEEYATFPRYNVLDAILVDVERLILTDYATFEDLQALLILAGQTAESPFTSPSKSAIANRAMAEERKHFAAYIQRLIIATVRNISPLPYRRTLLPAEQKRLWLDLNRRWGTEQGYWHPLITRDMPPGILAFQAAWFDHAMSSGQLRGIFARRGITRLWELGEGGPAFEIATDSFEPMYAGAEGYWTSPGLDWLIYASHESSITIAGDWLIAEVKALWPDWEEHLWIDWDYERPPEL